MSAIKNVKYHNYIKLPLVKETPNKTYSRHHSTLTVNPETDNTRETVTGQPPPTHDLSLNETTMYYFNTIKLSLLQKNSFSYHNFIPGLSLLGRFMLVMVLDGIFHKGLLDNVTQNSSIHKGKLTKIPVHSQECRLILYKYKY